MFTKKYTWANKDTLNTYIQGNYVKKNGTVLCKISTDQKVGIKQKLEAELMSHVEKLKGTSMVRATPKKRASK